MTPSLQCRGRADDVAPMHLHPTNSLARRSRLRSLAILVATAVAMGPSSVESPASELVIPPCAFVAASPAPSCPADRPPHRRLGTTSTTPSTTPTATPSIGTPGVLLDEQWDGPDGLLTNEYAFWNSEASGARRIDGWRVTSGSLFRRDGTAWTGVPDDRWPGESSATGTNSAAFRLITERADFGNSVVTFDLVHAGFVTTGSTPAVGWDGVHVLLRYQSEESLYAVTVNRRDGALAIKKKVPGGSSNGGSYYTLATGSGPFRSGAVQRIRVSMHTNDDGTVTITLFGGGGRPDLTAIDAGVGGPPIIAPGRVGIRGDNSEFTLDRLLVTEG